MLTGLRRWASGAGLWGRRTEQTICFDVSDLIYYFKNARAPTGIQRVQIEVISALLRGARRENVAIRVCAFSEQRGCWSHIPDGVFLKLCDLSLAGTDVPDLVWTATLRTIIWRVRLAPPMRFVPGAVLVNLGTSWWLPNYDSSVRAAKMRYGIRYIPFIHDLIPVMTPEHCIPGLTRDFAAWISAVLEHADHFLVNSQSTRADLLSVAMKLGHEVPPDAVTVVSLNADFRMPLAADQSLEKLEARGLKAQGYVLFVSTIESRKNHLGALSAWRALIGKHGVADMPMLVCVGNEGWLNADVHAKLDASETLRSRVVMLSGLPDGDLAALYDNCMFTLYPSHYEGWGLPVTESLCHGKVPLVSNASSLPEAGGPFADYFDAGSEDSMIAALERLIFDGAYRAQREQHIREAFRPRSWLEIGKQIEQAATMSTPG